MFSKKSGFICIFFLLIIIFSFSAVAEIVVFEEYKTTYTFKDNTLFVEKNLKLKNVGASPIIPGEIHFKVSQSKGNDIIVPKINNFIVKNKFDKTLDSRQIKTDKEMTLVFTIWDPLLPRFHTDLTMTYEIDFKPSGLIFYDINIPEEKTTIPIRNSKTDFILPKKYSVTYAPDAKLELKDNQKIVSWDSTSNLKFEYSVIPLPSFGFRMVNIFWFLVIVVLLIIFIFRILSTRS
jgi:hypothetical protein